MAETRSDFLVRATWDQSAYSPDLDPAAWMQLEIEPALRTQGQKIPADLVLVVDVSSSMNRSDKYPLVRHGLKQLFENLSNEDRLSLVIFSHLSEVILPLSGQTDFVDGLQKIDRSKLLFGKSTQMAPALGLALDQLELDGRKGAVRRVYALSDGELHDFEACQNLAPQLAQAGVEFHIYGFGNGFNVEQIATLSRCVPGGTCKPLVDTEKVVATFRSLGNRAANIAARNLQITVRFAHDVVAGDAFRFRPHAAWLGAITEGSTSDLVHSVEIGRSYSYLLEMRLPPQPIGPQKIASVTLTYETGGAEHMQREVVNVHRDSGGRVNSEVRRACDLCLGKREQDPASKLAAARARLELAREEHRDTGLIAALERQIERLLAEQRGQPEDADTVRMLFLGEFQGQLDRQYLEADSCTEMNFESPAQQSHAPPARLTAKDETATDAARKILEKYTRRGQQRE